MRPIAGPCTALSFLAWSVLNGTESDLFRFFDMCIFLAVLEHKVEFSLAGRGRRSGSRREGERRDEPGNAVHIEGVCHHHTFSPLHTACARVCISSVSCKHDQIAHAGKYIVTVCTVR